MKISPVEAKSIQTDGQTNRRMGDGQTNRRMGGWMDRQIDRQTDLVKLIVTFRNFANAPKD